MKNFTYILFAVVISSLFSCVPSRQFDEMKARAHACEEQNMIFKTENQELMTRNTELLSRVNELERTTRTLEGDTMTLGTSLRRLNNLYNELTASYDKLLANNEKLLAGSESETRKVITELQSTQADLLRKEDELRKLEDELNRKSVTLADREARVSELQGILARQDSVVNALKNTVAHALRGFSGQGLTVEERNGKVYVSLEERLLFASGSTVVDPKGVNALKELAQVLAANPDININVEGHTDDVPIAGQCIKDNWDLSVMRATSVTRIILSSSNINPARITASGKGEYTPLDTAKSADARRKNRRTEIILTPKLDELLRILGSN